MEEAPAAPTIGLLVLVDWVRRWRPERDGRGEMNRGGGRRGFVRQRELLAYGAADAIFCCLIWIWWVMMEKLCSLH